MPNVTVRSVNDKAFQVHVLQRMSNNLIMFEMVGNATTFNPYADDCQAPCCKVHGITLPIENERLIFPNMNIGPNAKAIYVWFDPTIRMMIR